MAVGRLLGRYEAALRRAPLLTTGVVSGGLGFGGDALAQVMEARRRHSVGGGTGLGPSFELDRRRTGAFTVFQALWGALGFRPWMHFLARAFPDPGALHLAGKLAAHHLLWNPFVYLPVFYVSLGALQCEDPACIWERARAGYWNTLTYVWKIWVPLAMVIFCMVPVRHQTGVTMACNLAWNTLLSLLNNKGETAAIECTEVVCHGGVAMLTE